MARPMPLAMQYIATNGWCRLFAEVMLSHPAGLGGTLVDLERKEFDDVASFWDDVHTMVRLPDGRLLDAEGARDEGAVFADWSIPPSEGRIVPSTKGARTGDVRSAALIAELADALGWTAGDLPDGGGVTASDDVEAASDAFHAMDAEARKPDDVLAEMLQDARSAVPGAARLARAMAIMDKDPDALFFDLDRGADGLLHYGLRYRGVDLVECTDNRDTWRVDLHVEGVPPVNGKSGDGDPFEEATECLLDLARRFLGTHSPEPMVSEPVGRGP